jgi:hypothetical protein
MVWLVVERKVCMSFHTANPNRPKTYSPNPLIILNFSVLYISTTDNYTPHQPATQSP